MSDLLKALTAMSLGGAVTALGLLALRALLQKRVSHRVFYYLWLVVLLRLCLPLPGLLTPGVPTPASAALVSALTSAAPAAENGNGLAAYAAEEPAPTPAPTLAPSAAAPRTAAPAESQPRDVPAPAAEESAAAPRSAPSLSPPRPARADVPGILTAVWAAGALALILWHVVGYSLFARGIRRSARPAGEEELAVLESMVPGRAPALCHSENVSTPMLMGFLHPTIVLPCRRLTPSELRHVLAHECTHYRRADLAYKWFATLVLAMHWFNPLCPVIRRFLDRDCELSCDEAVIENMSPDEKQDYGNLLILLSAAHPLPRSVPATTLSENKEHLKERLVNIMKTRKRNLRTVLLALCALVLLCGCAATVGTGRADVTPAPEITPTPELAPTPELTAAPWTGEESEYIPSYATDGNAYILEEVTVSTVDELLAAIAPNTTVILEPGVYNLTQADTTLFHDYCYWKPAPDRNGIELWISNVYNLQLRSATGRAEDVSIVTEPRYANVLTFSYCGMLNLQDITLGHTEGGYCTGGVIYLENCYSVYMEGVDLYGCGTVGVNAINSGFLTLKDSVIHDCSYSALQLIDCPEVYCTGCEFLRIGNEDDFYGMAVVYLDGCAYCLLEDCLTEQCEASCFLSAYDCTDLQLDRCTVRDNFFTGDRLLFGIEPAMTDCVFEDNTLAGIG